MHTLTVVHPLAVMHSIAIMHPLAAMHPLAVIHPLAVMIHLYVMHPLTVVRKALTIEIVLSFDVFGQDILLQCWSRAPRDRPDFSTLLKAVQQTLPLHRSHSTSEPERLNKAGLAYSSANVT